MLQCHVKGCVSDNYPLAIQEAELESVEADFNPEFLKRLLGKIDWAALVQTAFSVIAAAYVWFLTE